MKKKRRKRMIRAIRNFILFILALAALAAGVLVVGRMDFETEVEAAEPETEEETETAETAGTEEVTSSYKELSLSIPYGLSLEEVYEIARVTYLETGIQGEGYEYVTYLTACVIINRYLDWGYESIFEVTEDEGQYSTVGWETDEINDVTWEAVYRALTDTDRNVHFQASNYWLEGYGYELYYDDGVTQIYR